MSNKDQLIDFKELRSSQTGEGLEGLTRMLGYQLDLQPQGSGRGADGGRDFYFTEICRGELAHVTIKWLVSCKDHADSEKSVTESDLPRNLELKLQQHKCEGFLIVTTTVLSAGAKALLDGIDKKNGGQYYTKVWDETELRAYLLKPENANILRQFLPKSYERINGPNTLQGALERFSDQIPPAIYTLLMANLTTFKDKSLHGATIWPKDSHAANKIDVIIRALLFQSNPQEAQRLCEDLGADAFVALVSTLLKKDKKATYSLLNEVISSSAKSDLKRNSAQYLLDNFYPDEDEVATILLSLDEDDFHDIALSRFADLLIQEIIDSAGNSGMESDLNCLGGIPNINWVYLKEMHVTKIEEDQDEAYFKIEGPIDVEFSLTFDNEQETGRYLCPGSFSASFDGYGFALEDGAVDTADYFRKDAAEDLDYYEELAEQHQKNLEISEGQIAQNKIYQQPRISSASSLPANSGLKKSEGRGYLL